MMLLNRSSDRSKKDDEIHEPPDLHFGKSVGSIPLLPVAKLTSEVVCSYTGPSGGITQLEANAEDFPKDSVEIAGSSSWSTPSDFAYAMSLSLYEEDKTKQYSEMINGVLQRRSYVVGSPIADVYAVAVRENSAIIAIADGVSWGKKPRLAARCAVRAAVEYITNSMDRMTTSHAIITALDEAVEAAHQCILEHSATITTLSAAFACQMARGNWGLFVISVGDSPIYVYSLETQMLREATLGSHRKSGDRNMKQSGGAIGPAIGNLPDLENLSVSYTLLYPGDIVIAVTDGISDNFYTSVIHPQSSSSPILPAPTTSDKSPNATPELLRSHFSQECCENLAQINALLQKHQCELSSNMSAQTVAACIMNYAATLTEEKRQFRAQCIEQSVDILRRRRVDPEFDKMVSRIPGKLDHATVVTYQVGLHKHV